MAPERGYNAAQSKTNHYGMNQCFTQYLNLIYKAPCFLGSKNDAGSAKVGETNFVFLDLFVSRPVGRFLTGVALVEPCSGIKRQKESQALSHYAGPPLPALIESSDPKLMRRGAGAHLLSTADVLQRQTGERR
ncbi:hypothetical protein JOQ06_018382 [Pogonophryne albipinna]|uniref:Uncharacterized protein n=1 Tax=Pogonophryne albipinna TaxID=1090488 RepID=A0AAD6AIY1_9TELE|nr:hypothetical protein JOQ06_018382 [Pogonophryne albipinna]